MKTLERADSYPNFTQLTAYEVWAAQNWLHTPGTDDAQLHARAKLDEEAIELAEALDSGMPEDIISEAGDVLWTATASGSNTGISVSQSLIEKFPDAFSSAALSTRSIDKLALELFSGFSIEQVQTYLKEHSSTIGKSAKQWFRLAPLMNTPAQSFGDALTATKRNRAVEAIADITLLTSYAVQEFASSNLEEVMNRNYQKIEQRIKAGADVTKPPRI